MEKHPRDWSRGLLPALLVVILAVAAPAASLALREAPPQAASLPTLVPADDAPDEFLWVAVSELLDERGNLVSNAEVLLEGLLSPPRIDWLRRAYVQFRNGELRGGCIRTRRIVEFAGPGPSTFNDIVGQARAAIRGKVIGRTDGFLRVAYSPGAMLEIAIEERRFGDSWYADRDSFYLFFPAGEVPFGDTTICSSTFADGLGLPPAPHSGDEVVFLPRRSGEPRHSTFPIVSLDLRGYELAYERDGTVSGRRAFVEGRTLDELWAAASEAFVGGRDN